MNMEEVKKSEIATPLHQDQNTLTFSDTVFNGETKILYIFNDDGHLISGIYEIKAETRDKAKDIIAAFQAHLIETNNVMDAVSNDDGTRTESGTSIGLIRLIMDKETNMIRVEYLY